MKQEYKAKCSKCTVPLTVHLDHADVQELIDANVIHNHGVAFLCDPCSVGHVFPVDVETDLPNKLQLEDC